MGKTNNSLSKIRILFFINTIGYGGRQRRFVELMSYLKSKNDYELKVIILNDIFHYNQFFEFKIPYVIMKRKMLKKDPRIFWQFYQSCRKFRPHIIHTWENMPTFYSLPAIKRLRIPLVNSQITNGYRAHKWYSFDELSAAINFRCSTVVTSNSKAGLESYGLQENKKYRVIYNGISPARFMNNPSPTAIRRKYDLNTKYAVIMVASLTDKKDYKRYLEISKFVGKERSDITFFAVGDGPNLSELKNKAMQEEINNIRFTGSVKNIEALLSICDIGILFTNKIIHGEGISNAILEYMAMGKPVIANDTGGTKEIVKNNENGYLITNESDEEIANLIIGLIDDDCRRKKLGDRGRLIINNYFTIDKMGQAFERIYSEVISDNDYYLNDNTA